MIKQLQVKKPGLTTTRTPPEIAVSEKEVTSNPLNTESRIVLRANAASWVELREAGGKRLISKILRPGDTYQVPVQAGVKFTTGNAGGIDILIDGKIVAALGPIGAVRRDILMDPDTLLSRVPGQR